MKEADGPARQKRLGQIEQQAMQAYLQQTETRLQVAGDPEASLKALTLACHALYASSRFQYVE